MSTYQERFDAMDAELAANHVCDQCGHAVTRDSPNGYDVITQCDRCGRRRLFKPGATRAITLASGNSPERFVCGTRTVIAAGGGWRVACATCHSATGAIYPSRDRAIAVAVSRSSRPCRACGAR